MSLRLVLFIFMLSNAQPVTAQNATFITGNQTFETVYENVEGNMTYNETGVRGFPPEDEVEMRIIGGSEAYAHSWPWQVSLRFATMHTCGGAIISDYWIVTAAHCFLKYRDPMFWTAVAGKHDLNNPDEACEQARDVAAIVKHHKYNRLEKVNDIALVKVLKPFIFNICVRPINVLQGPLPVMKKCTITGWGATVENGQFMSRLQEVNVTILPFHTCNSYYYGRIRDQMFCAGETAGGADACQGDSGGPISCFRGRRYALAGVVSWGVGCGRAGRPGVYTNLHHYKRWMDMLMASYRNYNNRGVHRAPGHCGKTETKPCNLGDAPAEVVSGGDQQRVLNVTTACPHSWPWQVSLQHDDKHYCSGILIRSHWVLAPRQCHCKTKTDVVVLGAHHLRFMPTQTVRVKEVINMEGGLGFPPAFDLSLIRLREPARFGHTIGPVCLHTEEEEPDETWSCVTTGWGCTDESGVNPDLLHQARVLVVDKEACRAAWGEEMILNSHFCASPAGSPACLGDFGGPILCLRNGTYNLVGMATWSSKKCDPKKPSVFTRMAAFQSWITDTIGD